MHGVLSVRVAILVVPAVDRISNVYMTKHSTSVCLLEHIQSGSDAGRQELKEDKRFQTLAQTLGIPNSNNFEDSLSPEVPESWPFPRARKSSRSHNRDDVTQGEELTKRRAIPSSQGDHTQGPRAEQSKTADGRPGSIDGQSQGRTSSEPGVPEFPHFDPRDQYRIFCPKNHRAPEYKSITVFGQSPWEIAQRGFESSRQHQQKNYLRIPEYYVVPSLFEEDRCPLAAVYTDFRDLGRRQLAEGTPLEDVLGSPEVELSVFFHGRRPEDPHTPNTWACEYMRLLKDFDIYLALASIFTYSRFMRWTIAPSEETYSLLPDPMRPTALQRLVQHHPGIDLPIFPEMRDGLIHDMRDYIVAMQTLGCSVNWDYGLEAAIDIDQESGSMTVSEMFQDHICNLANWSVSQRFADVFPELRGYYRVLEQDTIPMSEVDVEEFLTIHGRGDLMSVSSSN
ncbi:hypothetical protein LTR10_020913 [Elasticomyces elasticus]|uniref:Uncharacterized protein n=1 Tax=Exophiala sideris TaxID=1016849 RepID=A0ABR0JCC1_9EURO|nr:hypothetical protein LTR10_020913 [Elasticomyces elasticus]KAK5031129.1 hypothetical protein LTS07_004864 [Exophiala sideris]KAK5038850.1 hypothetical protein LTR13_003881 [Exophiala sideris]KAK5060734.1 hypothetical protein LTR69_005333 [Exophiala sideris]KAK5183646.1 hypothetical protein LTR44_003928 [Eurotiomycetes sp. CCFEE 6388]